MTYVIHGATGAQGAPVVSVLTAAGKPVVALTRNADAVVPGARVMTAAYSSVQELTDAYRGAEGVFVHLPVGMEEDRRTYARNIVAAVRAARPARVVFSTSGFPLGSEEGADEENSASIVVSGLADSGVSHAVIAPELFFENLLLPHVVAAVRERGVLGYPLPAGFAVSGRRIWTSPTSWPCCSSVRMSPAWSASGSIRRSPEPNWPRRSAAGSGATSPTRSPRRRTTSALWCPSSGKTGRRPRGELPGDGVAAEPRDRTWRSAQKLLGLTPRTAREWLGDMDLR